MHILDLLNPKTWHGASVGIATNPTVEMPKEDPNTEMKCTYCGGTKFFEGPSGGMSTNILCANPECRHWFNYHQGILPMDDLHRIEPSEAEKAVKADQAGLKKDAEFAERIMTGVRFYKEGGVAALRQEQLAARSTYPPPGQIDELCGYMAAMHDELKTLRQQMTTAAFIPHHTHSGVDGHYDPATGKVHPLPHRQQSPGDPTIKERDEVHPSYGPGSITDAATYEKVTLPVEEDAKLATYRMVAELTRHLWDCSSLIQWKPPVHDFIGFAIGYVRQSQEDGISTEGENFIRDVFYKRE